ncbi:acyltransferase [Streptomyces sp. NRRL F-4489]|uniref:acyltransferase family protein n=1 Tax=Streptomyces sp. NRRL F-4489 TaxID=1609095 RepID=UPI000747A02C|nr:acyltransferase [Streptomyces sp. NRRL F-4489]KUL40921.1 acyltransferase [Streptomyces sp. NRRL F-4489]
MTTATAAAPPAPPAAGRTAPARRARDIDGFRGLAALSTVAFHVWQQYTAYDAAGAHPPVDNAALDALLSLEVIDLFFVLSAFLLTHSYARAALDGGTTRPARAFLFRRAVRILPLYVLAVLVVWATRNPTLPGDWRDLLEHLTFTHVFDQDRIFYTLGPTWSLSLEVLFYAVLAGLGPLAVRACRRLRRRGSRVALLLAGCLALYAAPLAWITVAHYGLGIPHTDWVAYFGPQARFGGFAAGMALAVVLAALGDRARLPRRAALPLTVLTLAGLFTLSLRSDPESFPFTYYHPIAAALWALLLLSTLHIRRRTAWNRFLTARWLTPVGLVSYSLFIWHEPVMLLLHTAGLLPPGPAGFPWALPLVFLAALPVAAASYWLIEYPAGLLGRLKDGRGRPRDFYPGVAAR